MSTTNSRAAYVAVPAFVLLWGSAALFTRWALDHGSVFAVLMLRFALALGATSLLALPSRRWLPAPGTRRHVATTGLLLIGGYSICYFLATAQGITPGLMSTLLGVQPILTLLATERRFSPRRISGLALALAGLILVVYQSLRRAEVSALGLGFAMAALLCMTVSTLMQKNIKQPPLAVLPLQYLVTLLLLLCVAPSQPLRIEANLSFVVPGAAVTCLSVANTRVARFSTDPRGPARRPGRASLLRSEVMNRRCCMSSRRDPCPRRRAEG